MRYIQLDPTKARKRDGLTPQKAWDAAVDAGNDVYCTRMHNIWCGVCAGLRVVNASEQSYLSPAACVAQL